MDTIKFKNGSELQFEDIDGLTIFFRGRTVEELAKFFTVDNLTEIHLINSYGLTYGIYKDLKLVKITTFRKDLIKVVLTDVVQITL